ncbi:hypothetical protein [Staphylococcus auricularis]|nr:hypothetical protein [Staphylococcus auricularis]
MDDMWIYGGDQVKGDGYEEKLGGEEVVVEFEGVGWEGVEVIG